MTPFEGGGTKCRGLSVSLHTQSNLYRTAGACTGGRLPPLRLNRQINIYFVDMPLARRDIFALQMRYKHCLRYIAMQCDMISIPLAPQGISHAKHISHAKRISQIPTGIYIAEGEALKAHLFKIDVLYSLGVILVKALKHLEKYWGLSKWSRSEICAMLQGPSRMRRLASLIFRLL